MNLAVVLARTGEGSKAGPIGLAVILLLCITCYFLFKSMSKHMRYVRENFPGAAPEESEAADDADPPDRAASEDQQPPTPESPRSRAVGVRWRHGHRRHRRYTV